MLVLGLLVSQAKLLRHMNSLSDTKYSGTILGVYATTNGRGINSSSAGTPAYISDWKYTPQGQFLS